MDIAILARAFWSTPESPNWNQRADLNVDGIIDLDDLSIICAHYGEEY
jgi:hypothetical protein